MRMILSFLLSVLVQRLRNVMKELKKDMDNINKLVEDKLKLNQNKTQLICKLIVHLE